MTRLSALKLQHVRCHSELELEFSKGVNIILGPNACGKTTVLEAISLVASDRRQSVTPKDLLQKGSDWLRIDANFESQSRSLKFDATRASRPAFAINDNKRSKLRQEEIVPTVWFSPPHTNLLRSSPSKRRAMLDDLLSQLQAGYSENLRHYWRALSQRNRLLKTSQLDPEQLFVWSLRLVEYGAQLVAAREQTTAQLNLRLADVYTQLSQDKKTLTVEYLTQLPTANYADKLLQQLRKTISAEQAAGHTLYGPHLDDWQITEGSQNIVATASQGETRSIVLAIKLIEADMLSQAFGQPPLLLLDDIFSELDGARRRAVVLAASRTQAFITTTDADVAHKDFSQAAKLIAI